MPGSSPVPGGDTPLRLRYLYGLLLIAAVSLLSIYTATLNYLLFHSLVEIVTITVGFLLGVVAWYTYRFSRNHYLAFLGLAYPAIASLDLVHTLAYKGMGIFSNDANLPTQLWIAARGMEAFTLLIAPRYLQRPLHRGMTITLFITVGIGLLLLITLGGFPTMYVEGQGLTPAKVNAEYLIVVLIAMASYRLWRRRQQLERHILYMVYASLGLTMVAELFFTVYIGVYDISNLSGHLAKLASFVLIFIALVRTGLAQPFRLLSRNSSTYDAIPEEITVVDEKGLIRQINRVVERRFGNSELLGRDNHALFHPGGQVEANCPVCVAIQRGQRAEFELYYPQEKRWRLLTLAPIVGEEFPHGMVQTLRDITELRRTQSELQRINRALRAISASNKALIKTRDEEALLYKVCNIVVHRGGYRMAWVGFRDDAPEQRILPQAWDGEELGYLHELGFSWGDNPLSQGPAGRALRSGKLQIANDIANDPSYTYWRDAALKRGYAATMAFPLANNHDLPLGVLVIYSAEANAFTEEEINILSELAGDLAYGIGAIRGKVKRDEAEERARHWYHRVAGVFEDTVAAISGMVEMRDPYTAGHQFRVAELAVAIGRELKLEEEQLQGLHMGGLVHDVGKLHVPAELLSKPGSLSDAEFEIIKTHPQAGYEIFKGIEFPWPVAEMIHQHHERLDGTGYPLGLSGEAIRLESRILSVADVVEAIASYRPYRPGLGIDAALEEIEGKTDTLYDRTVVDACIRLFRNKGFTFPAPPEWGNNGTMPR